MRAEAGQTFSPEQDVSVTFWNPRPLAQAFKGTRSDSNANSVVFSLQYRQRSFLFTGDLEGETETQLKLPHADVLKVAHHGSAYSTTISFLQKVSPSVAVISVGQGNRYGHPTKATLGRLQDAGATIWRTDTQGAIICETNGENLLLYSHMAKQGEKR
jgi:competence protein ComEC